MAISEAHGTSGGAVAVGSTVDVSGIIAAGSTAAEPAGSSSGTGAGSGSGTGSSSRNGSSSGRLTDGAAAGPSQPSAPVEMCDGAANHSVGRVTATSLEYGLHQLLAELFE